MCVYVCTRSNTKTSPLSFQGVAEGAYAVLPEAGGDWRTCRLCPERG